MGTNTRQQFKRGDVLEFHCGDQKQWEPANGAILIVTKEQTGNTFSGRWITIAIKQAHLEAEYDFFDAIYFTKITEIDREDTDAST